MYQIHVYTWDYVNKTVNQSKKCSHVSINMFD